MRPLLTALYLAGMGFVGACSGTHEPHHERATPMVAAPVRRPAVLDVPSLLPLSIDEVGRRVGPSQRVPLGFVDPVLIPLVQRGLPMDSTALFRYEGLAIVAAYNHNTRRISDLLLLGSNEQELMNSAQLQVGAEHYLVLPVFQQRQSTKLLGLRVLAVALNQ